MILADGYPLGDVLVAIVWLVLFAVWFLLAVEVFSDLFRRDLAGWAKAAWILAVLAFPFLGVLAYLVTRPGLSEAGVPGFVPDPSSRSVVDELGELIALHDAGAIDDEEFARRRREVLGET